MKIDALVNRLQKGDPQALAKTITLVETEPNLMRQISKQLLPSRKETYIIGITGPVGAGKSTVINSLVQELNKTPHSIGIILIDPSSTLSGGAFLGDRMQMSTFSSDVFIRSLAAKGGTGGLFRSINDVVALYEAFGKDMIIIEIGGNSKAELEIHHLADTVVVVLMPGAGDAIHAFKGGINDVTDIIVVNKADLEGANTTLRIIGSMLDMRTHKTGWRPPVLKLVATQDEVTSELLSEIEAHRRHLELTSLFQEKRQKRIRRRILQVVEEHLKEIVEVSARKNHLLETVVSQVWNEEIDVYEGVDLLLAATMELLKSR